MEENRIRDPGETSRICTHWIWHIADLRLTLSLLMTFFLKLAGTQDPKPRMEEKPDPQHTGFGIEPTETHLVAVDDLLPEVGLGELDNILPLAGTGIAVAPTTTATAAGTTFTVESKI
jgi:hypothetical protein